VPKQVYDKYLTLIIHPGPPGDAGPSALDWVLMGDTGEIDDPAKLLKHLGTGPCEPGRSHWGVTVLQAIEEFDAGPVWAFDQFAIDIDDPSLSKSEVYRGPVTRAAVSATLAALARVKAVSSVSGHGTDGPYSPTLQPEKTHGINAVTDNKPFQGGKTHARPLLKAADRDFDLKR
jgi:hypothetical protein